MTSRLAILLIVTGMALGALLWQLLQEPVGMSLTRAGRDGRRAVPEAGLPAENAPAGGAASGMGTTGSGGGQVGDELGAPAIGRPVGEDRIASGEPGPAPEQPAVISGGTAPEQPAETSRLEGDAGNAPVPRGTGPVAGDPVSGTVEEPARAPVSGEAGTAGGDPVSGTVEEPAPAPVSGEAGTAGGDPVSGTVEEPAQAPVSGEAGTAGGDPVSGTVEEPAQAPVSGEAGTAGGDPVSGGTEEPEADEELEETSEPGTEEPWTDESPLPLEDVPLESTWQPDPFLAELDARLATEPFDAQWGVIAEHLLSSALVLQPMEGSAVVALECRTTLCVLQVWHEDPAALERFWELLPTTLPLNTQNYAWVQESELTGLQSIFYVMRAP